MYKHSLPSNNFLLTVLLASFLDSINVTYASVSNRFFPVVTTCSLFPATLSPSTGAVHASSTVTPLSPVAVAVRALAYLLSDSRLL